MQSDWYILDPPTIDSRVKQTAARILTARKKASEITVRLKCVCQGHANAQAKVMGSGGPERAYKEARDKLVSEEVPLVGALEATIKQFNMDFAAVNDVEKVAEAAINAMEEAAFSQAALDGQCRRFHLDHVSSLIARLMVRNLSALGLLSKWADHSIALTTTSETTSR